MYGGKRYESVAANTRILKFVLLVVCSVKVGVLETKCWRIESELRL